MLVLFKLHFVLLGITMMTKKLIWKVEGQEEIDTGGAGKMEGNVEDEGRFIDI